MANSIPPGITNAATIQNGSATTKDASVAALSLDSVLADPFLGDRGDLIALFTVGGSACVLLCLLQFIFVRVRSAYSEFGRGRSVAYIAGPRGSRTATGR